MYEWKNHCLDGDVDEQHARAQILSETCNRPSFGRDNFRQRNLRIPGDQLGGAITFIGMVDHFGAHLDAFFHVREDGDTIDEMPLAMFMAKPCASI